MRDFSSHTNSNKSKYQIVLRTILCGMLAAVTFHFVIMRLPVISAHYPYNTFLFDPGDRFNDFINIWKPFNNSASPYESRLSVYFPATYLLLSPIKLAGPYSLECFLLISTLSVFTLVNRIQTSATQPHKILLSSAILLSYPILHVIDRSNVEILLLILVFLWWIARAGNHDFPAAALIGLAGAAKVYPLLLLLPDLISLRWRRLFLAAGFAAGFSIIGLLILSGSPSHSIRLLSRNLGLFHESYILYGSGVPYSTSILSTIKAILITLCLQTGVDPQFVNEQSMRHWRLIVYLGLPAMILAAWRLRRENEWKTLFVAVAAMLLLPPVSFDYKLIHLILPLLLFINTAPSRDDRVIALTFSLLLIPKAYYFLYHVTSVAVIINPILVCFMLWIILRPQSVIDHQETI